MDLQDAQEYVVKLFRFVLNREPNSEDEVKHWTQLLLSGRDPIKIFDLFANCTENRNRLALIEHSRSQYPNGHFYSPVVDKREAILDAGRIFSRRGPAAIDMNSDAQLKLFDFISNIFLDIPFSENHEEKYRYYFNNTSYGFGDACIYWGMLAHFRPNRLVEIGSGFTSALALDCIDKFLLPTSCTFVDPYPQLLLKTAAPIGPNHKVIADKVQNVDLTLIDSLEANDILFIDSSHIVKTGSDVHFEISEMLPRVKPGVIIHFHDIFYPFEYPKPWVLEKNLSWNELYFLQAFLMYNKDFEIIYFNDYIRRMHANRVEALPRSFAERIMLNPGGGLWLRRI